jgi:hypothetical protein
MGCQALSVGLWQKAYRNGWLHDNIRYAKICDGKVAKAVVKAVARAPKSDSHAKHREHREKRCAPGVLCGLSF